MSILIYILAKVYLFSFLYAYSYNLPLQRKSNFQKFSSSKNDEWSEDDLDYAESIVSVSDQVRNSLDNSLSTLVTTCALNTVSYYMIEFHDDITQRWMVSFDDYKQIGFKEGKWQIYLEDMIKFDKQELKVKLQAPMTKRIRGKPTEQSNKNYTIQYTHVIEPRKIAHQILTVREDVAGEIIRDMGSIKLENKEAIKFARDCMIHGLDYAVRHRGVCRMGDQGGTTPLREKNFLDCAVVVTNLAIGMVKSELVKANDVTSLKCLEKAINDVTLETESADPMERKIRESYAPRRLLEELCYMGMKGDVTSSLPTSSVEMKPDHSHYITLSKNLMKARYALAMESCKVLQTQSLEARDYYRMIKNFGGFAKFDFSKPKMEIVFNEDEPQENPVGVESNPARITSTVRSLTNEELAKEAKETKAPIEKDQLVSNNSTISVFKDPEESPGEEDLFTFAESGHIGPVMM